MALNSKNNSKMEEARLSKNLIEIFMHPTIGKLNERFKAVLVQIKNKSNENETITTEIERLFNASSQTRSELHADLSLKKLELKAVYLSLIELQTKRKTLDRIKIIYDCCCIRNGRQTIILTQLLNKTFKLLININFSLKKKINYLETSKIKYGNHNEELECVKDKLFKVKSENLTLRDNCDQLKQQIRFYKGT
jgi:hypothetical protein